MRRSVKTSDLLKVSNKTKIENLKEIDKLMVWCQKCFSSFVLQFRSEKCVPKRMKEIKKAILERDFKTFAETTMKVTYTS